MPIELIKKTGKVDLTAYIPKGNLPTGIEVGEFIVSPSSPTGNYKIEHTLGVIPNVILIYREDKNNKLVNGSIRACIKMNVGEYYEPDYGKNVPEVELIRSFYDTSSGIGQTNGTTQDIDSESYFYAPSVGSRIYLPGDTYKWIAIAYGGNE